MSEQIETQHRDFPDGAALVVGGSGGIGQAICVALAQAGVPVALTYRSRAAAAERTVGLVEEHEQRASAHPLDLADVSSIQSAVQAARSVHGVVHSLIFAAGVEVAMEFIADVEPALWIEAVNTELNGFFHLLQALVPEMRERGEGSIVAVTTAGIHRYPSRDILSVAPKAGVEALVRGIAREEGRFGIRANSVAVGVVDGGMFQRLRGEDLSEEWVEAALRNTALRRIGTLEEIADAVVFLASHRSSFITGQSLRLDGGYSI
jgi:NAD(P)-dependent dehydrogenase (short-subunit alcohol dehydrogenase family)